MVLFHFTSLEEGDIEAILANHLSMNSAHAQLAKGDL